MLFFMIIINTVLSILYIVYVFFSIKIYQDVPERRVIKQEFVPYTLNLNNESIFAYRSVKLRFMEQLSQVKEADKLGNIGLKPGQKIDAAMELCCKYSGTYYVGVDTIEIMDYFNIFHIRFHMPQKLKVIVKPRVLKPDNIAFITEEEECRNSAVKGRNEYLTDNEVRKYVSGDNKRLIHWKNSAKRQELMVRKVMAEEISEYVVILDGRVENADFISRIILCDKLRETVIAMVNYIYCAGYNVLSVLDRNYEKEICYQRDFNEFYNRMVDYYFDSDEEFDKLLLSINQRIQEEIPFIIISAKTEEIQDNTWEEIKGYRNIHVIDVNAFEDIEELLDIE